MKSHRLMVMGQKEDLLAGAKQCLASKGYAHTTARDIVAVTGANLASIGYHFGSKEALLNAAIMETFDTWGDAIAEAVTGIEDGTPAMRLEGFLHALLEAAPIQKSVLVASVQAYSQAEFAPEIRDQLTAAYSKGRRDLVAFLLARPPETITKEQEGSTGSLALAIINGVMLQWMVDRSCASFHMAEAAVGLGQPVQPSYLTMSGRRRGGLLRWNTLCENRPNFSSSGPAESQPADVN